MEKILEGIKVLDLTQGAAGPSATRYLGEMGADVIKVEPPEGEWVRAFPPFTGGEGGHFLGHNRCKRAIAVDLKNKDALQVIKKMAANADVVMESYRPGVIDRLGLGYKEISAINPKVVYCSISGFGQTGPYAQQPGVDGIMQGIGGIMSVTGEKGRPPARAGTLIADMTTGMFAANSVIAALFYRERSKVGQKVDVCLLDVMMALQMLNFSEYLISGKLPERTGSEAPYACPNGGYPTKDGYIMMAAYVDKRWRALCKLINREDLVEHPDYATNPKRVENREKLNEILNTEMKKKTSKEWLKLLSEVDILCGPINTYEDLVNDPQVKENNMIIDVEHPTAGKLKMVGFAPKFSVTPLAVNNPPPLCGQHTVEVLRENGYADEFIEKLLAEKAFVQYQPEPMKTAMAGG